jgi:hypothetical protein
MHAKIVPETKTDPAEDISFLREISLAPIHDGQPCGPPVMAGSLWDEAPIAIFVARRPGCPVCRMDAREISKLFKSQFSHIRLIAIIKEIAPTLGALTDKELGVAVLQSKFFQNYQLFLDSDRKFYQYFGNKTIMSQPYSSTPCALYSDYRSVRRRMRENDIDDYILFGGENNIKGGFLLVSPTDGIVYRHNEMTGSPLPIDDIEQAVLNVIAKYAT